MTEVDYYLQDEEKFGFFASRFYGMFARMGPMRKFHEFALQNIMSRKPSSVLDIGFGTGDLLRLLCSEEAEKMELFGVEPSPHMMRVASRRLRKCAGTKKVILSQGSSRDIPYEQNFDMIFSSLSFHHWKDPEDSLKNILNHLSPNGVFLVFEFGRELLKGYKKATASHSLSLTDLEKFSGIAGYEVTDDGEHRCVEFRKPAEK